VNDNLPENAAVSSTPPFNEHEVTYALPVQYISPVAASPTITVTVDLAVKKSNTSGNDSELEGSYQASNEQSKLIRPSANVVAPALSFEVVALVAMLAVKSADVACATTTPPILNFSKVPFLGTPIVI